MPTEDGTAIGDALVRAIDMLEQAEGASKAIILLTDGSYNAGEVEPLVAAQLAAAYGIRIHAIGAGSRGTALMPVAAADGGTDYLPSEVTIDEATLEQIAAADRRQVLPRDRRARRCARSTPRSTGWRRRRTSPSTSSATSSSIRS